jgi:thiamine biosynthesis protein ThiS
MKVVVKLHGETKRYVKNLVGDSVEADVPDGSTVQQLLDQLGVADEDVWMSAVNKTVVKPEHVLADGDAVEVFAPVQGGSCG